MTPIYKPAMPATVDEILAWRDAVYRSIGPPHDTLHALRNAAEREAAQSWVIRKLAALARANEPAP